MPMKRPPHSSSAYPAQRNGSSLPGASAAPPVALALSTTAAVRAAVLAGAGPAVLSELAVS